MYEGDEWESRATEICAIIVRAFKVDVAVLDSLPALEVVVKHGVGVNTVDLEGDDAPRHPGHQRAGRQHERGRRALGRPARRALS